MSAAGFDTLKLARKLKAAGLPDEQAEAQAEVLGEAFLYNLDQLVSRDYLDARLAGLESRLCTRMDARFAEVEARFADMDARFADMDARFADVDARFVGVDARFVSVDARFAELEARLTAKMDARFKAVDEQFVEIKGQFRLVHWMLALILAANVIPSLSRFLG